MELDSKILIGVAAWIQTRGDIWVRPPPSKIPPGMGSLQEGVARMKKMLLTGTALLTVVSGSAMAADLTRPAPAPAPVYTKAPMMPAFTWTGCYVGANVGGLWAKKDWTNVTGTPETSATPSSWLAGGQVGCNYQVSTWVFGIQV